MGEGARVCWVGVWAVGFKVWGFRGFQTLAPPSHPRGRPATAAAAKRQRTRPTTTPPAGPGDGASLSLVLWRADAVTAVMELDRNLSVVRADPAAGLLFGVSAKALIKKDFRRWEGGLGGGAGGFFGPVGLWGVGVFGGLGAFGIGVCGLGRGGRGLAGGGRPALRRDPPRLQRNGP